MSNPYFIVISLTPEPQRSVEVKIEKCSISQLLEEAHNREIADAQEVILRKTLI
jgi:hypothetical protein